MSRGFVPYAMVLVAAFAGLALAGSLDAPGSTPSEQTREDVYVRPGTAFHDAFRLDVGERIEFRFRDGSTRSVQLSNITAEGKAELVYMFDNGQGGGGAMVFFAGVEDMGFPVEVMKLTENKALMVIPHPVTPEFPN